MKFKVKTLLVVAVALTSVGCRSRDQRMSRLKDELNESIVSPRNIGGAMVVGEINLTGNRNVAGGLPKMLPNAIAMNADVYLSREQFVVSFDSKAKLPAWTAWQLVKADLGHVSRQNNFRGDEILNTFFEVTEGSSGVMPDHYRNTCFDKGHQSPAADRSNSQEDNDATFFMSNMAPQTAFLNRGIWKDLEEYGRAIVESNGYKLQSFAGGILRDGREGIGPNREIKVPTDFYKVIAVYDNEHAKIPFGYIAVIMPNLTADGLDPLANRESNCLEQEKGFNSIRLPQRWQSYVVTISDIEYRAGVSFPQLAGVKSLKVE